MTSTLTHFEIFGPVPETLVEFYRNVFGWHVEEMPGLNYWRTNLGATKTKPLSNVPDRLQIQLQTEPEPRN